MDNEGNYKELERVFAMAVDQAANGKGKERHALAGESFEEQLCCSLLKHTGPGGAVFQACKKALESLRLPYPQNVKELLGAMNYLAADVIDCERLGKNAEEAKMAAREDNAAKATHEQTLLRGLQDMCELADFANRVRAVIGEINSSAKEGPRFSFGGIIPLGHDNGTCADCLREALEESAAEPFYGYTQGFYPYLNECVGCHGCDGGCK